MKILQIGSFPLNAERIRGGVEASVYGLSKEQAKNNDVSVLDIPRVGIQKDNTEFVHNLEIFRFTSYKRNLFSLVRIPAFLRLIKSKNPDICHLHTTNLFILILYVFLKLNRMPVVLTVHGLAHIEKKNTLKNKGSVIHALQYLLQSLTEFIFLSVVKSVIVDTDYVKEMIIQYKREKKLLRVPDIYVIPQGIDDVFYSGISPMPENPPLIVSVGAINKRKGQLRLLDVLYHLKKKTNHFHVVIAGFISDQLYYQKIQKKISEYELNNYVELKTDLDQKDILQLYEKASIFALYSEEESQGIVFCEAMACGLAIVTTNVGGIPYVVKESNGYLSEFENIEDFSDHLLLLLQNENDMIQMSKNNQKAAQEYRWSTIEARVLALYNQLFLTINKC